MTAALAPRAFGYDRVLITRRQPRATRLALSPSTDGTQQRGDPNSTIPVAPCRPPGQKAPQQGPWHAHPALWSQLPLRGEWIPLLSSGYVSVNRKTDAPATRAR